jgi:hypothetical protein
MGGGDLNLKKDWHTQTIKNMEKVWLAEQKAEAEVKRIELLMKERRKEKERAEFLKMQEDAGLIKKRAERLEWMYAGPSSNTAEIDEKEEYLLGKKKVKEEKEDYIPGVKTKSNALIFKGITPQNAHRDLQNKIREDPLFAIKMKEKDRRMKKGESKRMKPY